MDSHRLYTVDWDSFCIYVVHINNILSTVLIQIAYNMQVFSLPPLLPCNRWNVWWIKEERLRKRKRSREEKNRKCPAVNILNTFKGQRKAIFEIKSGHKSERLHQHENIQSTRGRNGGTFNVRFITGRYINEKDCTSCNFTKINHVFYGTS